MKSTIESDFQPPIGSRIAGQSIFESIGKHEDLSLRRTHETLAFFERSSTS